MADDEQSDSKESERSRISDELGVPDEPPDPAETPNVLPEADLRYPTFEFPDGEMEEGAFSLQAGKSREELIEWLDELAGGLTSHDVGVKTPEELAVFGVGPGTVEMAFDPDEDNRGRLEVTISLRAKLIAYSDDPDEPVFGARGSGGFIPVEMLTGDDVGPRFRCWNWIEDPMADGCEEEDD